MQDLDFGSVKIETEHIISGIGKACASHEAYIASTNHRYLH
jgi:hypothetical protein